VDCFPLGTVVAAQLVERHAPAPSLLDDVFMFLLLHNIHLSFFDFVLFLQFCEHVENGSSENESQSLEKLLLPVVAHLLLLLRLQRGECLERPIEREAHFNIPANAQKRVGRLAASAAVEYHQDFQAGRVRYLRKHRTQQRSDETNTHSSSGIKNCSAVCCLASYRDVRGETPTSGEAGMKLEVTAQASRQWPRSPACVIRFEWLAQHAFAGERCCSG
jgi:hypothetical protein